MIKVEKEKEHWKQVVDFVASMGDRGATSCDVAIATGIDKHSAGARISELCKQGILFRTGEKRRNRKGILEQVAAVASPQGKLLVEKPKVEKPKIEKPKIEKPKIEKPKVEKPKVGTLIRQERRKRSIPLKRMVRLSKIPERRYSQCERGFVEFLPEEILAIGIILGTYEEIVR